MFTLKQMQYFSALAREGHFGRAANATNVTQPTLSAQIAEMERISSKPLFERNRARVVLTELGKRIAPRIEDMLEQARALNDMVAAERDGTSATLHLGMIPTLAPYLLPSFLPKMAQGHMSVDIKLREAMTETLVEELRDGTLDAIVAATPIADNALREIALFEDRFFVVSASNRSDVLQSPMQQDQVVLDRLLLLDEGHCLRDQALDVCTAAQGKQLVNFGATSLTTLLQMVSNGMGMTLLPEIAINAETSGSKQLKVTPFADPQPARSIALFYRASSYRTDALSTIAETLRATAQTLLQPSL